MSYNCDESPRSGSQKKQNHSNSRRARRRAAERQMSGAEIFQTRNPVIRTVTSRTLYEAYEEELPGYFIREEHIPINMQYTTVFGDSSIRTQLGGPTEAENHHIPIPIPVFTPKPIIISPRRPPMVWQKSKRGQIYFVKSIPFTKYEPCFRYWHNRTDARDLVIHRLMYLFETDLPYASTNSLLNNGMRSMFMRAFGDLNFNVGFRSKHKINRNWLVSINKTLASLVHSRFNEDMINLLLEEMMDCVTSTNVKHGCFFCHGSNDHIRINIILAIMSSSLPQQMYGNRLKREIGWEDTHCHSLHFWKVLSIYLDHSRSKYMPTVCAAVSRKYIASVNNSLKQLANFRISEQVSYIPSIYNILDLKHEEVCQLSLLRIYEKDQDRDPDNGNGPSDQHQLFIRNRNRNTRQKESIRKFLSRNNNSRVIENHAQMFSVAGNVNQVAKTIQAHAPQFGQIVDDLHSVSDVMSKTMPGITDKLDSTLDDFSELIPSLKTTTGSFADLASMASDLVKSLSEVVPSLKATFDNTRQITEIKPKNLKYSIIDLITYIGTEYVTWPAKATVTQMAAVLYRFLQFAGFGMSKILKSCTQLISLIFSTTPNQPSQEAISLDGEIINEPQFGFSNVSKFLTDIFRIITNVDIPIKKLKEWSNVFACFTKVERGFTGLLKICKGIFEFLQNGFYWLKFKICKDLPKKITEEELLNWCSEVAYMESAEARAYLPHSKMLQDKLEKLAQFGIDHMAAILQLHIRNPIVSQFQRLQKSSMDMFNEYFKSKNFSNETFRVAPWHLVLHGAPGVGKSVVSSSIIRDMDEMMGNPALNRAMNRNASDQYWSGYMEQRCIRIDDAFQVKEGEIAQQELCDYFMMFSSVPFALNMPDIASKGKLFKSKMVISCTNTPFPFITMCTNKDAVYRRRNELCYVRQKPGVDPKASLAATGINTNDHLLFRLTNPLDASEVANLDQLDPNGPGWLTYQELIEHCMQSYMKHMENQERLKANIESRENVFDEIRKYDPERAASFEALAKEYADRMKHFEKLPEITIKPNLALKLSDDDAKKFVNDCFGSQSATLQQKVKEEAEEKADHGLSAMFGEQWTKLKEKMTAEVIFPDTKSKFTKLVNDYTALASVSFDTLVSKIQGYDLLNNCKGLAIGVGIALAIYGSYKVFKGFNPIKKLRELWDKEKKEADLAIKVYFNEYLKELEKQMSKDPLPFTGIKPTNLVEMVTDKIHQIRYIEQLDEKEQEDAYAQLFSVINAEVFQLAEARYGGGSVMKIRHAQVPKKASVFSNTAQMNIDQNTQELMREVSDSMCLVERMSDSGDILQMRALLVRSNVLVMPAHFFGIGPHEGTLIIKQYSTQREISVEYSQRTVTAFNEVDICVVDLGYVAFVKKNGKGIKLHKKFISESELGKLSVSRAMFMSLDDTGSYLCNQLTMARSLEIDKNIEHVDDSYYAFDARPRRISYHKGYKYQAATGRGMCGSPLISMTNRMVGRVMALHVSGGSFPVGHTLPREKLQEVLSKIPMNVISPVIDGIQFSNEEMDWSDITNVPHVESAFTGNFTHLGRMDRTKIPFQNTKTAIVPSLIAEDPVKFPAPLNGRDRRIDPEFRTERLMLRNAQAYGDQVIPFDLDVSERVCDAMFERWRLAEQVIVRSYIPGVQTEEAALNGYIDDEFNRPIMLDTSPGYPYIIEKREEKILTPGKAYLFDRVEFKDRVELSIKRPELRKRLDARLAAAKKGKRVESIWYSCLKDETLKEAKIKTGKTRLFYAAPVDYAIAAKMYFGDFRSMMCNGRSVLPGQVGANFEGPDTTRIVERLLSKNSKGLVMDGDFVGFDQHQDAQTIMLLVERINRWYRQFDTWKPEDDVVRRVLISEVIDTLVLVDGELVIMHQSLPSGFQLTIDLNNLINEFYHLYAWMTLAFYFQRELADPSFFYEYVMMICMGDDVLTSCVEGITWWTMKNIALVFEQHGIQYTSADKTGILGDAKPITEVEFCKRSFVRHPNAYHIWMAPLSKTSIMNPVNWIHDKNLTREEATVVNVEGAVREAFYHGKREFKEVRRNLTERLRNIGLECRTQDYEYYDARFLDQFA